MSAKILVADDEKRIVDAISYALLREGYQVEVAYDGEEALRKIESFHPKIAILDVMMPKKSGFDVCKQLENKAGTGIILLTAKNDIVDKVLGLEFGADDYITKPFDIRELGARVKSLLRRLSKSAEQEMATIEIGDLKVLIKQRKVALYGKTLDLTPKEFDLFAVLASNPERVYSREELLDVVWGIDYAGGTRTVDIHIQRLRKKLGHPYHQILQTVYGVGYKATGEIE
ncbi:response regulator transcription factor [Paenactinomyces guangxiensis]|uniref:Response regulator transcription factor n=1 Tax=Paenactinomyces guangxiensis TaxID=1490290 RepID=A0A7W2A734_9BACL|nr:response regulator transcription factor [Paenactinomyces guangxiensis]MBA4492739.1 response regulator transcription factor [Paenactinomyces guangxiensis]MBH8590412.1 response regulator transcription factor [Paenactinomyces guangxiensis]